MAKIHRIETYQLAVIMIVARFFSLLSFIPSGWSIKTGMSLMLGDVLGSLLTFVAMIPMFYLFKDKDNILTATYTCYPWLGKVASVFYWLYFLYAATDTIAHFHFFMTSAVYPTTSAFLFLLFFCLTIAYFVYMGIEAIARSTWIFFILIIIGVVIVALVLIPKIRLVNCVTPFFDGVFPVIKSGYGFFARNAAALIFLGMASNTKGSLVKSYGVYTIIITILAVVTIFYAITILGDYGSTKPFPIFTVTAVAETKVIKRLDSIFMYIWIFCALVKSSVYIYLAGVCLEKAIVKESKVVYISLNTTIVFLCSYFIVSNVKIFDISYKFINTGISQMIFIYAFPMLILVLKKFKGKKAKKA